VQPAAPASLGTRRDQRRLLNADVLRDNDGNPPWWNDRIAVIHGAKAPGSACRRWRTPDVGTVNSGRCRLPQSSAGIPAEVLCGAGAGYHGLRKCIWVIRSGGGTYPVVSRIGDVDSNAAQLTVADH